MTPDLYSEVTRVAWPAIPESRSVELLALVEQLDHTQWWPAPELRRWQLVQAATLLRFARAMVPYYREAPAYERLGTGRRPIDPEAWAGLPVLGKRQVREAGPRLLSPKVPSTHGEIFARSTSGSTGEPLKLKFSALSFQPFYAGRVREALWQRADFSAKMLDIRLDEAYLNAPPEGVREAGWGRPFDGLWPTGPLVIQPVYRDLGRLADCLVREAPAYLTTMPSNLRALLAHTRARGLRVSGLRRVRTLGEPLAPELRAACRAEWGAPISDMYGGREAGYLALQCPDHEHYHVQSESVLLEVLDREGRACGPGEVGRVVITPLHNFVMPLIRYEIGDYAEVGAPCPCGRGLPVLTRILGRSRNMATLPSGETRFGVHGTPIFAPIAAVRQYQVVQRSLEEIEARVVADRDLDPGETERIRRGIVTQLCHPFRVEIRRVDAIPGTASGKYEEFVSEVDD